MEFQLSSGNCWVFLKKILFHQFSCCLPPLHLRNHMEIGSASSRSDISNCSSAVSHLMTRNVSSENPTCKQSFSSSSFLYFSMDLSWREGRSEHFPFGVGFQGEGHVTQPPVLPPTALLELGSKASKVQSLPVFSSFWSTCYLSYCWSIWVIQACKSLFQWAQINDLCSKYFMNTFSQLIFIISLPVDIMDWFSGN